MTNANNDAFVLTAEIFLFLSLTTSHVERRKRLLLREDWRRTKSFCRRADLVYPSVDYCCLECSMEEDNGDEEDYPLTTATISTATNFQTSELLDKIRRAIDLTKRLQKRYAVSN